MSRIAGVSAKAGEAKWERICGNMERVFREGRYEQGAVDGIREVIALLATHFPANGATHSELPDKVVVL